MFSSIIEVPSDDRAAVRSPSLEGCRAPSFVKEASFGLLDMNGLTSGTDRPLAYPGSRPPR